MLLYFSRSVFFPFGGSTGARGQCLGAPDLLEQRNNGLEKSYRVFVLPLPGGARICKTSEGEVTASCCGSLSPWRIGSIQFWSGIVLAERGVRLEDG